MYGARALTYKYFIILFFTGYGIVSWRTRGVGYVETIAVSDTTQSKGKYYCWDIVSTSPTPVAFQEPIPHSMENELVMK